MSELAGGTELDPWLWAFFTQQLCQLFGLTTRGIEVTELTVQAHEQSTRRFVARFPDDVRLEQRDRLALLTLIRQ
jgi:hypothetical protein